MEIRFRKAILGDCEHLKQLALRSKSHWDYTDSYLKQCEIALKVDADQIHSGYVFVAESSAQKIIGFFAFKNSDDIPTLDHMWLEPAYIGRGYGRSLFKEAISIAKAQSWNQLQWTSDPPAEGFYLKMGAKKVGLIRSNVEPNMFLPQMILNL